MRTSFVNKTTIFLSNRCRSIMGSSRKGRIYELDLIQAFYNKLMCGTKNPVFLDIGANTGSFSLLPTVDKNIKCYTFEPNPIAYSVLEENVRGNGISDNVEIYNKGVWSSETKLPLKVPVDNGDSGLSTFGCTPLRFKYGNKTGAYREFVVDCVTIDGFVDENNIDVDAIKIDTEGSELEILRGGRNTLLSQKPLLLLEYDDKNTEQFGYNRDEIKSLLVEFGYEVFQLFKKSDMFVL